MATRVGDELTLARYGKTGGEIECEGKLQVIYSSSPGSVKLKTGSEGIECTYTPN